MDQSVLLSLESWWSEVSFEGKDNFTIGDNGEIILKALPGGKERVVATVSAETAAAILKTLTEKFAEAEARAKELETEWVQADDKLKLQGKVERLKDYLQHAVAVGNYGPIFALVADWEKTLYELSEENYKERLRVIEQAETLADSDSWKETTQAFKDLAEKWKTMGNISKAKSDVLWNRMEAARSKFYDRKRTNHEQHEQEMLRNLDLKMELVELAEGSALSEKWKASTEDFRQWMERWKATGRTVADKNEELWQRFITAKNTFYDRKKVHFDQIQGEQEQNYAQKLALLERAEQLKDSTEWGATSQAYATLMEEWKAIGKVPLEKADELWNRLTAAKDQFFQAKKSHFGTVKVTQDDNLAQKRAILKRAEALKNSTRWREATEELNELMDEWKKIGPVAREHSNAIWEEFIQARKHFFNRKDANRDERKVQAEKTVHIRNEQVRGFVTKLQEEIREEEERIADFRNDLQNVTPGRKAEELRKHLGNLISQGEETIARKVKKLEEAKRDAAQLDAKEKPKKETATPAAPQPVAENTNTATPAAEENTAPQVTTETDVETPANNTDVETGTESTNTSVEGGTEE